MLNHRPLGSRSSPQGGQAIIEFLVAGLVLIPLFLLMPLIGKYLDIKQSTIAASRKLAFECTVRYADCTNLAGNPSFSDEIRMRFFSGDTDPDLTNDHPTQDAIQPGQGNPLWVDNSGQPLLQKYSDIGVEADASNINPFGTLLTDLAKAGPNTFGLNLAQGLFNARVQTQLSSTNQDFLSQLNSIALKMQFHTAVMTNAWTADGPGAKGDKCDAGKNTVIARVSRAALCMAVFKAADVAYLPATLVVKIIGNTPLMTESNVNNFNFHDFMTPDWVDLVPTNDSVGYSRLQ